MNVKEIISSMDRARECEILNVCELIIKNEISVDDFAQTIIRIYEDEELQEFAAKILDVYYHLPIEKSLAIADLIPEYIRDAIQEFGN